MMNEDTNRIIVIGNVPPANNDKWHQRNDVFDNNGIVGCLTSTMFKDAPRVMVKSNDEE